MHQGRKCITLSPNYVTATNNMESSNRRHTLTQTPFLTIFRNVVELTMPSQYDICGLVPNRVFTTSTVCGYLWCIFLPTTHSHNCRTFGWNPTSRKHRYRDYYYFTQSVRAARASSGDMEARTHGFATQERQAKARGHSREAATWTAGTPLHGLANGFGLQK